MKTLNWEASAFKKKCKNTEFSFNKLNWCLGSFLPNHNNIHWNVRHFQFNSFILYWHATITRKRQTSLFFDIFSPFPHFNCRTTNFKTIELSGIRHQAGPYTPLIYFLCDVHTIFFNLSPLCSPSVNIQYMKIQGEKKPEVWAGLLTICRRYPYLSFQSVEMVGIFNQWLEFWWPCCETCSSN